MYKERSYSTGKSVKVETDPMLESRDKKVPLSPNKKLTGSNYRGSSESSNSHDN